MLSLKKSTNKKSDLIEKRTGEDRRQSSTETRFPFIDDNSKLVMKDRRVASRREEDAKIIDKSLKIFSKVIKSKNKPH